MQYTADDLEFTTSVDTSISQSVPIPQRPPTLNNNTFSGNITPSSAFSTAVQPEATDSYLSQFIRNSGHPIPAFFHVVFKAASIFVYLLGGVFEHGSNFITVTVICILLLAADFWVVKNITGRLLVGLRWWAQVEGEDGTVTKWIFEAAPANTFVANKFDATWFWTVLYATPVIWTGFFITGLLKWNFGWLITVAFAIALSSANVYGYWHCSNDQKAKFQQMVARGAEYGAGAAVRNNVFGKMASLASRFGSSSNGNQPQGPVHEYTMV
jgi:hypothetical protein